MWVETTVERIRALRPKSVWEIGCGTGLLLFRLAPGSERYYGTDISQTALGFLQQQLQRPELQLPQRHAGAQGGARVRSTSRCAGSSTRWC